MVFPKHGGCLMVLQRLSTDVRVLMHQLQHLYVLGEEHL